MNLWAKELTDEDGNLINVHETFKEISKLENADVIIEFGKHKEWKLEWHLGKNLNV